MPPAEIVYGPEGKAIGYVEKKDVERCDEHLYKTVKEAQRVVKNQDMRNKVKKMLEWYEKVEKDYVVVDKKKKKDRDEEDDDWVLV